MNRSTWVAGAIFVMLVGLGAGWFMGVPPIGRTQTELSDTGPGDNPPVLFETTDAVHGHIWRLVTYEEVGMTCIDILAYEPNGEMIGGGGGCDPSYPPDPPAAEGTAEIHSTGGGLMPIAGQEV